MVGREPRETARTLAIEPTPAEERADDERLPGRQLEFAAGPLALRVCQRREEVDHRCSFVFIEVVEAALLAVSPGREGGARRRGA